MSGEDNCNRNRPVTEKEIGEVLKEMQNGKAPGPDGFNVDFFKACWNIVKRDIVEILEDSRQNKTILKALNTSFISLIPKQDNAQTPERYRPIALCNVVYKIISKVVANRLKPLLPTLISGEQTGVPRRKTNSGQHNSSSRGGSLVHMQQESGHDHATGHSQSIRQSELDIHQKSAHSVWF